MSLVICTHVWDEQGIEYEGDVGRHFRPLYKESYIIY
jgi:hypothetical protein